MMLQDYVNPDPNEKPLDHLVTDGGLCSIFRTVACIGDSLASGELESFYPNGVQSWHDAYEYSWGQFLARMCGNTVYNFSRGGMTAAWYHTFAEENGFWDTDKSAQAYLMALGVNDVLNHNQPIGTVDDICLDDYTKNADTFAGHYGKIIQRIRTMQPHAPFFLITIPRGLNRAVDDCELHREIADLLTQMASLFPDTYVIDLFRYAPPLDENFKRRFYLHGHMSPAGYRFAAVMIASYIDFIIRHNPEKFRQVGFIGTEFFDPSLV